MNEHLGYSKKYDQLKYWNWKLPKKRLKEEYGAEKDAGIFTFKRAFLLMVRLFWNFDRHINFNLKHNLFLFFFLNSQPNLTSHNLVMHKLEWIWEIWQIEEYIPTSLCPYRGAPPPGLGLYHWTLKMCDHVACTSNAETIKYDCYKNIPRSAPIFN